MSTTRRFTMEYARTQYTPFFVGVGCNAHDFWDKVGLEDMRMIIKKKIFALDEIATVGCLIGLHNELDTH